MATLTRETFTLFVLVISPFFLGNKVKLKLNTYFGTEDFFFLETNMQIALGSCSLLQTVPTDVLEKGKAIADAYNAPEEDYAPEKLDPNLKQLESIL